MGIIFYSKDGSLANDLKNHYGTDTVVAYGVGEPDGLLCKGAEIVIIDLKDFTINNIQAFSSPLIALTPVPRFEEAVRLVQAGVKGYGNRKMRKDNLYLAIASVKAAQLWLPPEFLIRLVNLIPPSEPREIPKDQFKGLSKREREVAGYVSQGMSNQEMAEQMYVSLRTVKAHLSSIYGKTGFRNRLELGLHLKEKYSV